MININCIYTDRGAWCKNKNIKRSVFGLGARCCIEYPTIDHSVGACSYKEEHPKPKLSPCPPKGSKVLPLKPWPKPPIYKNPPTPPPSVRRKEGEQPPGKVIVVTPNKQYCEIINGFIELVEKRTKKLRGDTEVKKDNTTSYVAMKQIQKEINNERKN